MFRELAKKNKQISDSESIALLKRIPRGVLSLQGDAGYPYGVPTNFWYSDSDGYIYFHSGKQGHKVDAILANPKASLSVMDSGVQMEKDWAKTFQSVIVFGEIEVLDPDETALEIVRKLSLQFTDDLAFIEKEIVTYGARTLFFRLVPRHMTGKQIREA